MALVRWNPWNLSSLLDDDFDFPTIPGVSRVFGQGLNIYETEQEIVAELAMPGIQDNQIDISIDKGIVRISATADDKKEEKNQRRYFMSSMSSSYNYSFRLPEGIVKEEEPEAVLQNGVLSLTFQKPEKVAPRKIKVVAKDSSAKEVRTKE
jgi:HSP20 family protein